MGWIENLKVGDTVIVTSLYGEAVKKVTRITPSGLIDVEGYGLFNKYGRERGGDTWSRHYLTEPTPEAIQKIREEATIRKAQNLIKKTKINYDQAVKIIEILGGNNEKQ